MVIKVTYTDTCSGLNELEFEGVYCCMPTHTADIDAVINRASKEGVKRMIVPGGVQRKSQLLLDLVEKREKLFATVAIHPTRYISYEEAIGPEKYRDTLVKYCKKSKKVVGIGKTGLDFSSKGLEIAPKEVQLDYLNMHFEVSKELNLPVFLQCKNSIDETLEVLAKYEGSVKGVVHTFQGTRYDAESLIKAGLYIGITGCSLKTEKSLEMVLNIPLKRLLLGTNCPTCRIKQSFHGAQYIKTTFPEVRKSEWNSEMMVKGRNEPLMIKQVVEAVAGLRNIKPDLLALLNEANTNKLFFASRPSLPTDLYSEKAIRQKHITYLDDPTHETIIQNKPMYLN